MKERCFLWLLAILLFYSCDTKQSAQETLFRLVPDAVDFHNQLTPTEEFNMYLFRNFYNGGGVAVGDVTGNGYPDLFFTGNMVSNRLYENRGGFQFVDITDPSGLRSDSLWSTGASMGDVNQDGHIDLFVAISGPPGGMNRHNKLYINQGDGIFTEQARQWGVADVHLSTHGVFLDYDLDGLTDLLVIANSLTPVQAIQNPNGSLRNARASNGQTKLYKNKGTHFEDVTEVAGLYQNEISFPLSAAVSDINLDGCPDLYIANDFYERDYLYINQCNGTFREELEWWIRSHSKSSMGSDIADLTQDGWPDIFVTDMLPWREDRLKSKMTLESYEEAAEAEQRGFHHTYTRNTLQINQTGMHENSDGYFAEVGRYSGVEATDWSWSALIADYDLDGKSDLYVTNGIYKDLLDQDYIDLVANPKWIRDRIQSGEKQVIMGLLAQMSSEPLPNKMFWQSDLLKFEDRSDAWGLGTPGFSNGAAWADLDLDGDLDLIVNELNSVSSVYENRSTSLFPEYGWLRVVLKGSESNPLGVGTRIVAFANEQMWTREQYLQRGFQSSVDPVLSMGTGQVRRLDSLHVYWPDGLVQTLIDSTLLSRSHHESGTLVGFASSMDLSLPLELTLDHAHAENLQTWQGSDMNARNRTSVKSEFGQKFRSGQRFRSGQSRFPGDRSLQANPFMFLKDDSVLETFQHQASDAPDFKREPHLRQKRSTEMPAFCSTDLTQNGLPDFYIGGGKDQAGSLSIQVAEGEFELQASKPFLEDSPSEDTDCVFFDANGDSLIDLYVVSGGTSYPATSDRLQDRLYVNRGSLLFEKSNQILPSGKEYVSGSVVVPNDINGDDAIDLFVGTRLVPFATGTPVRNYMLVNRGDGTFVDETKSLAPELLATEMVTDAQWADLNQDGQKELILAMEWGPLRVFSKQFDEWTDQTAVYGLDAWTGLWNTVEVADLNEDGYPDLIAGNHGQNSLYDSRTRDQVRQGIPRIGLLTGDPNSDGWTDQVHIIHRPDGSFPLLHQPEYNAMMPGGESTFPTHASFAGKQVDELFQGQTMRELHESTVTTLSSMIFWNRSGERFDGAELPPRAQLGPVYAIHMLEGGIAGRPAFLTGGNGYEVKPNPGPMDASELTVFWVEQEKFYSAPWLTPRIPGQIRAIADVSGVGVLGVGSSASGVSSTGDLGAGSSGSGNSGTGGLGVHDLGAKAWVENSGNQILLVLRYGEKPVLLSRKRNVVPDLELIPESNH